jgi:hypothetical protein
MHHNALSNSNSNNANKVSTKQLTRTLVRQRDKDDAKGTSNTAYLIQNFHSAFGNVELTNVLGWIRVHATHSYFYEINGRLFIHFDEKNKPPYPGVIGTKTFDRANASKPSDSIDFWIPKKIKAFQTGHRYEVVSTRNPQTFELVDIGAFTPKANQHLKVAIISITHRK